MRENLSLGQSFAFVIASIAVRRKLARCKKLRAPMFWHMSHKFMTIVTNVFGICHKGL